MGFRRSGLATPLIPEASWLSLKERFLPLDIAGSRDNHATLVDWSIVLGCTEAISNHIPHTDFYFPLAPALPDGKDGCKSDRMIICNARKVGSSLRICATRAVPICCTCAIRLQCKQSPSRAICYIFLPLPMGVQPWPVCCYRSLLQDK